jgi:nucleoside-triphosphatase
MSDSPSTIGPCPAVLLTGRPGMGKTTVIRELASLLGAQAGGFYTQEVRSAGRRTGFELVTLAGERACLATVLPDPHFDRQVPFGRYRVNLDALDLVGVPALLAALELGQVVVVDEIGPMEIRSRRFCDAVLRLLGRDVRLVGTIVRRSVPFADQVRRHPRVEIIQLTVDNRLRLARQLFSRLTRGAQPPPR